MPYTRPWDQVLNLLGSRDADEIDDASRETHLDLTERFADILEDVEADPWVLKRSQISKDYAARYHWTLGHVKIESGSLIISPDYSITTEGNLVVYVPVIVPVGWKLKWINFRLKQTGDAQAFADLVKIFNDELNAVLGSAPAGTTTVWEDRLLSIEDVPSSGTTLLAVVTLVSGSGASRASFMDMEVSYSPVV